MEWPNPLTASPMESPTIVIYPSVGVRKGQSNRSKRLSPREKMSRVATNVYSRKTLEKPKRRRSVDFENKGS